MENKKNILIDCDPGIDDAVAIALAIAHRDQLNICGITSVAGNQTQERVTGNALKLTVFLGAEEIPVAMGAKTPLLREIVPAGDIHGKGGLGYCELPAVEKTLASDNAVCFLREKIMALPAEEKMTLVPTGPLTNIGLLLKVFPEVKERIDQIVLMGGAAVGGNVTATAEFNIWEDPEAAQMVYTSGIPIVMCGLDVTMACGLNREQVAALGRSNGRVQKAYSEMLNFYFDSPAYRNSDRVSIHDAATIMYLLHPEYFSGQWMSAMVDCSEGVNRGMTICDSRANQEEAYETGEKNVLVLQQVDQENFQRVLLEALTQFDA
ncbi:MAG: nucleoside hydrolase [Lachnospiraceae bacterium]|nr:nucleoside hydrolase [Lachnospiraceae bacterium]